jgi:hypothetical protein
MFTNSRRFQFSLRMLLIVVAVLAIVGAAMPSAISWLFPPKPDTQTEKLMRMVETTFGQPAQTDGNLTMVHGPGQDVPGLDLRPRDGTAEVLEFKLDGGMLSIWQCDFDAEGVDTLSISVSLVENGAVSGLSELTVPLLNPDHGTFYLPVSQDSTRIIVAGVAAKGIQRYVPLKSFTLKEGYTLERSLTLHPREEHQVAVNDREALWVFVFSKPDPKAPAMTPSPFRSFTFADVVETAKRLPQSTVIIVSVQPQ